MLPFEGGGSCPVQYFVDYNSNEYYVRYRYGCLEITRTPAGTGNEIHVFDSGIGDKFDGYWNARETNVYLSLINDSIVSGQFNAALFPDKRLVRDHELYELGPLPKYPIGLSCDNHKVPPPLDNPRMNRHDRKKRRQQGLHDHDNACIVYVSAQDVEKWITDHTYEHIAFREIFPTMWKYAARDLGIKR